MNVTIKQSRPGERVTAETSYKFQRLREKIRRAIESGELSGKLPGERSLARRFHVNAKTLSKALTDLAAEGLLDRSIGRGTYVRGTEPVPSPCTGKWLIICDQDEVSACTLADLRKVCPESEAVSPEQAVRPSYLIQFSAVINLSRSTPDTFLRQLLVRNMPVVAVNHEPRAYSMHAVLIDIAMGVSRIGRDLFLGGHRQVAAIEPRGNDMVIHALRQAAARYAPNAVVEAVSAEEAGQAVDAGATALVCGSVADARQARGNLDSREIQVPGQVSLTAVGYSCPDSGCSGYFVDCRRIVEAVAGLLKDSPARPTTLWLPGAWLDRGTMAPGEVGAAVETTTPIRISGVVV